MAVFGRESVLLLVLERLELTGGGGHRFGLLTVDQKNSFHLSSQKHSRNMNDAVSPEKPSKRRGARDDDWSSSSFSSRFPLSFFFLSSQSAQKRDL